MLVKTAEALDTSTAALVGEDNSGPVEAIIYAQLGTPRATDLLAAFAKISDCEVRHAVLKIAQDLGAGQPAAANAA